MLTLIEIAENVARPLGRVDESGAIIDLETEIKAEIANAIRYYNRQRFTFTEVRAAEITTTAGIAWYDSVDLSSGSGQQSTTRTSIAASDLLTIEYMRTSNVIVEEIEQISQAQLEAYRDAGSAGSRPTSYARYAGGIGFYPTPNEVETIQISATVKPVVPTVNTDTSVWFEEAQELIENSASKRICAKHLQDMERAQVFSELEALELGNHQGEMRRKRAKGKLKAYY